MGSVWLSTVMPWKPWPGWAVRVRLANSSGCGWRAGNAPCCVPQVLSPSPRHSPVARWVRDAVRPTPCCDSSAFHCSEWLLWRPFQPIILKNYWCFCTGLRVWIRTKLPASTSYWTLISSSINLWCLWSGCFLYETRLEDVHIKPCVCKWTCSTWGQARLSMKKLSNEWFALQRCPYWYAWHVVKAGCTTPAEFKWD